MAGGWRAAGAGGLPLGGLPPGGVAQAADEPLVLQDVDLSSPAGVSVVATVPSVLSGRPLPPAAFSARQGAAVRPATAQRVVDGPAELVLAVDTSVPAALPFAQSAAADLLRMLPPGLPTVVLPGGARGTTRSALDLVGSLRPGRSGLLDDLPAAPQGRRLLVLLTGCRGLERIEEPTGSDQHVSVLVTERGCEERAREVAGEAGLVRTGLAGVRLLPAVDDVGRQVLGQYRVQVEADATGGPLDLTVEDGGISASSVLRLATQTPSPAAGAGPGTSAEPGPLPSAAVAAPARQDEVGGLPVLAAGALAGATGLGVLAVLRADRRRLSDGAAGRRGP